MIEYHQSVMAGGIFIPFCQLIRRKTVGLT
nr:MAG TPA: hypothetical protein [Caudoviricetes sp.]